MNSTRTIKYTPITLILLFTIFGIPWEKNTIIIRWKFKRYQRKLIDYVDHNTRKDAHKRHCVQYILPHHRKTKIPYPDKLNVHFTKDVFKLVSMSGFRTYNLEWNVGHIEYQNEYGHWRRLIPTLNKNESFVIPVSIKNGQMPNLELFLKLLPKELREDAEGNKTQVNLNV